MNISSVIVYVKNLRKAKEEIERIKECQVHLMDEKKAVLIVSIEAESTEKEVHILNSINSLSSVLEAHLHYSYSQEELEKARENLLDEVPAILDDSVPMEEVRYSGSVYNQMKRSSGDNN